jgi:hypothetical protein
MTRSNTDCMAAIGMAAIGTEAIRESYPCKSGESLPNEWNRPSSAPIPIGSKNLCLREGSRLRWKEKK